MFNLKSTEAYLYVFATIQLITNGVLCTILEQRVQIMINAPIKTKYLSNFSAMLFVSLTLKATRKTLSNHLPTRVQNQIYSRKIKRPILILSSMS